MTTVVLVEDDHDIRELATIVLERAGFEVRAFATARPALDACIDMPPAVVMLDRNLPGIDGLELLACLRQHPATAAVPVVMMSAQCRPADVEVALRAGVQAYLAKPFTIQVLVEAARQHACVAA